jgi:hypothetical protein
MTEFKELVNSVDDYLATKDMNELVAFATVGGILSLKQAQIVVSEYAKVQDAVRKTAFNDTVVLIQGLIDKLEEEGLTKP